MDEQSWQLYRLQAEVLKAMAHPLRLAIVDFLRDRDRCVCEIAEHTGAGRSNVSRHLALMLKAGVLASRKDGLKVYYRLNTPCVLEFFSCVSGVLRERLEAGRELLSRL